MKQALPLGTPKSKVMFQVLPSGPHKSHKPLKCPHWVQYERPISTGYPLKPSSPPLIRGNNTQPEALQIWMFQTKWSEDIHASNECEYSNIGCHWMPKFGWPLERLFIGSASCRRPLHLNESWRDGARCRLQAVAKWFRLYCGAAAISLRGRWKHFETVAAAKCAVLFRSCCRAVSKDFGILVVKLRNMFRSRADFAMQCLGCDGTAIVAKLFQSVWKPFNDAPTMWILSGASYEYLASGSWLYQVLIFRFALTGSRAGGSAPLIQNERLRFYWEASVFQWEAFDFERILVECFGAYFWDLFIPLFSFIFNLYLFPF